MAKFTLPEFTPELRIVARGTASNRLVVSFDTATEDDLKRSPRIVMIDTQDVTSIRTSVDDLSCEDLVNKRYFSGKIHLLTQRNSEEATKYLLADFQFVVEALGRPDKTTSKYSFPSQQSLGQLIQQGVADAFTDASFEMHESTVPDTQFMHAPSTVDSGAGVLRAAPFSGHAISARPRGAVGGIGGKKAYIAIAVLVLVLLAAALKIAAAPVDPVQAAVNNALASDPRARDEQIEITRQTLKEMGLDPGKNGDLGCLVAP